MKKLFDELDADQVELSVAGSDFNFKLVEKVNFNY